MEQRVWSVSVRHIRHSESHAVCVNRRASWWSQQKKGVLEPESAAGTVKQAKVQVLMEHRVMHAVHQCTHHSE